MRTKTRSYVHGGVDLADGFVVCRELVYLDAVAHQLAHDLDLELVQLALRDRVRFGNNGDNVDLRKVGERGEEVSEDAAISWIKLDWRLIKDIKLSKAVHVVDGAYGTRFNVTAQSDSNYESKQGRTDAGQMQETASPFCCMANRKFHKIMRKIARDSFTGSTLCLRILGHHQVLMKPILITQSRRRTCGHCSRQECPIMCLVPSCS